MALLRLLLALCCVWLAPARAQDTVAPALPEVSLVTVEPGELYWQRFGHNAILLRDPMGGRSISYNFGYFDFAQEDFLLRFLRGKMLYQAVALDDGRPRDDISVVVVCVRAKTGDNVRRTSGRLLL